MRVKWMMGLTQRSISSTASGSSSGRSRSFSHSPRYLENASRPPLIAFARGLVARLDDELAVHEQLQLGERLAVDLRAEQVADDVVARVSAGVLDELSRDRRASRPRAAGWSGPAVSPGRRNSGSSLPITSLVHWKSSCQSERGTPRIQEITAIGSGAAMRSTKSKLARAVGRHGVEDLDRDAVDLLVARADGARSEARHRDAAQRSVARRIERDDHLRRLGRRADRAQDEPVRVREDAPAAMPPPRCRRAS